MDKQTGPKNSEVLSEASSCLECAALQWLQTITAPCPLLYIVVLTEGAEQTDGHLDRKSFYHRGTQGDEETMV